MKIGRRAALFFSLIPLLFLASCLDYREELWIHANGSGKIHATIAISSELGVPPVDGSQPDEIESQLRELFAMIEGATVDEYQTYIDGKKRIYDFTVSFRDLQQLKPAIVSGEGNIGAVFGDFEIEKIPDGRLSVKRTVKLTDASFKTPPTAEDAADDDLGNAIGKAIGGLFANTMLADYHLDYITHFPTEVKSANSPNIDHPTSTVTWRFPLSQASQGPVIMNAEIKQPGRWMTWIFVAMVVLVTLAIVGPAFRKK